MPTHAPRNSLAAFSSGYRDKAVVALIYMELLKKLI